MKIENKLPIKNHNVSSESDSSLFTGYIWFFIFLLIGLYLFFITCSYIIVAFISIEDEKVLFSPIGEFLELRELPVELLQRYASSDYTIYVVDINETENAFADLWWRVYITQTLLDNIEYREELDFIIGHEFAHIKNRDVLKRLISDIPVVIILSLLGWDYGAQIFEGLLGNNYSKLWETRADKYALDFTNELNGHVWCALDFLEKRNTLGDNIGEMFSTHPITDLRLKRAQKYIKKMWYWMKDCSLIY